ncbi:M23 family metallopeptidase [Paenibacillus xanthanilyticus]
MFPLSPQADLLQQLEQALRKQDVDWLYARVEPIYRQLLGTRDQFADTIATYGAGLDSLKLQTLLPLNGTIAYGWTYANGSKGLQLRVTARGELDNLSFHDMRAHPDSDRLLTKLTYDPPFEGEWTALSAGPSILMNELYEDDFRRYGIDWIIANNGYTFKPGSDRLNNESYYAYGQKILAPQDGVVIEAADGTADNEMAGVYDESMDMPFGNYVILDHRNGEFSFLAHMKNGSLRVQPGDSVRKGDWLGNCGNSGVILQPMLHMEVFDANHVSVPIRWAGGAKIVRGSRLQGASAADAG